MKKTLLLLLFAVGLVSVSFAVKPVAKQIHKNANTQLLVANPNAAGTFADIKKPSFISKVKMTAAKVMKAVTPEGEDNLNAILAHLWLLGWLIALILNQSKPSGFTAFYLRQTLGLMLFGLLGLIPVVGIFVAIAVFILWIISIIGAVSGKQRTVPVVGKLFQKWFAGMFE